MRPRLTTVSASRRVLAGCALLLAAGCSSADTSDSSADSDESGATTTESATADASAFPVTVEDTFGQVTVEAPPERVAALGFGDQDVLLALGIVPVVANQFVPSWTNGVGPWGQELLDGQDPVAIDGNDLNLEKVLATGPDLAVAANLFMEEGTYDTLSEAVPVVGVPAGAEAYSIPWQEHTTYVGEAVGLGDEAQALVEDVEGQVEAAAEAHPELAGKSVQVVTALPEIGNVRVYTSTARGYVLEALGMDIPAWVDEEAGDGFYVDVSDELVSRVDADVIVFLGAPEELEAQPLLAELPAVQDGSVVYLEDDLGVAFAAPGPLTIPYFLDDVLPQLSAAAEAGA